MLEDDVFIHRIIIDGIGAPVCFTFRMLHGQHHMQYKIRTKNPVSDFNMRKFNKDETAPFEFTNKSELPEWLINDKHAQTKLSNVIIRSF